MGRGAKAAEDPYKCKSRQGECGATHWSDFALPPRKRVLRLPPSPRPPGRGQPCARPAPGSSAGFSSLGMRMPLSCAESPSCWRASWDSCDLLHGRVSRELQRQAPGPRCPAAALPRADHSLCGYSVSVGRAPGLGRSWGRGRLSAGAQVPEGTGAQCLVWSVPAEGRAGGSRCL